MSQENCCNSCAYYSELKERRRIADGKLEIHGICTLKADIELRIYPIWAPHKICKKYKEKENNDR